MRIGCSTITFGPQSLEEALAHISDLEFSVIDLSAVPGVFDHVRLTSRKPEEEVDRVAALVSSRGFEVAALLSVPWVPDAIDDPQELRRRYSLAADVAQAVRARTWVVDANRADGPSQADRQKGLDRFRRTIEMAAELAAERGLHLAVEAPHSGTLAVTLPEVVELLEVADLPQLGIDFDTSHVLNAGASVAEVLEVVGPRIAHVALRDAQLGGQACTPGDGAFDFAELFRMLDAYGYTDDMILELEPPREDSSVKERAHEAMRAQEHLQPLLATVARSGNNASQ